MSQLVSGPMIPKALKIFAAEYVAEKTFQSGKPEKAMNSNQQMMDEKEIGGAEKGWYLQEMARYAQAFNKEQSNELQIAAHRLNRYLLKPQKGMAFDPISAKGQKRIERIVAWIKDFLTVEDLMIEIEAITTNLRYGVASHHFKSSLHLLGT